MTSIQVDKYIQKYHRAMQQLREASSNALLGAFPSSRCTLKEFSPLPDNRTIRVADGLIWLATGKLLGERNNSSTSDFEYEVSSWCSEYSQLDTGFPSLPDMWRGWMVETFSYPSDDMRFKDSVTIADWEHLRSDSLAFEDIRAFFNDQCILGKITMWGLPEKGGTEYMPIPSNWFFHSRSAGFDILSNRVIASRDTAINPLNVSPNAWNDIFVETNQLGQLAKRPMYLEGLLPETRKTLKRRNEFQTWMNEQVKLNPDEKLKNKEHYISVGTDQYGCSQREANRMYATAVSNFPAWMKPGRKKATVKS